jgi:peptidyl-dipeptidase Dcp
MRKPATSSEKTKRATKTVAGAKSAPRRVAPPRNPLLALWKTGPLDLPPFGAIRPDHFPAAFREGMKRHRAEVLAIAADPRRPTFANTIVALEKCGRLLSQTASVFWNLVSADSSPALQALERDFAPKLAAHWTKLALEPRIFARIDDLWARRDRLGLDPEQLRVLERHHVGLVRSGAKLDKAGKTRIGEIAQRLATLSAAFMQNVLKDEQDWRMILEDEADLAGLPPALVDAARRAAEEAGHPGKWAITLARLLGYDTFAAYRLEDSMARTPGAVRGLLERVWKPARARAMADRDAMQALIAEEGGNFTFAAWDWRFYAEKLRQRRANFDDSDQALPDRSTT